MPVRGQPRIPEQHRPGLPLQIPYRQRRVAERTRQRGLQPFAECADSRGVADASLEKSGVCRKGFLVAVGQIIDDDYFVPSGEEGKAIAKQLRDHVAKEIGPIAKPKDIRFGENLPKTRSGKIMRRLLRSLAKGEAITQDTSTLENPHILGQLGQAY